MKAAWLSAPANAGTGSAAELRQSISIAMREKRDAASQDSASLADVVSGVRVRYSRRSELQSRYAVEAYILRKAVDLCLRRKRSIGVDGEDADGAHH